MTIEKQIIRLGMSVEGLAHCLASLDEAQFLKKLNGWSPRDIAAHLTGWNRYIIEGSNQIKKGELPFYDIDPGENYSKVNAELIRRYPSRDKQELLAELRASAGELSQFLKSLDPAEWERDYGVKHRGAVVTIQNTVDELIEDYVYHTGQIKEWAESLI